MTHAVILSGGLDSTAVLAREASTPRGELLAVSFDYGQRHRRELDHAARVAGSFGVGHKIVDLTGLLVSGPALLEGSEVPDGSYDEPSMISTVVLGRNLLFASAVIALLQPGDTVTTGVHAGDHPIYPDCRPEFWAGVRQAAEAYGVKIETPYIGMTKAEIVADGLAHRAPFELTWSCYQGGRIHCGRCGTCRERAEAFDLVGVPDPTQYESRHEERPSTV